MARIVAVFAAWLALTVPTGYALAALGAGSLGAGWVIASCTVAGIMFSPILVAATELD